MQIILILACVSTLYMAFSFGKYIIECQLTQDWDAANWAIFRSYKDIVGKPKLSVAEYSNIRSKQQDEKIKELSQRIPTKVYGRNNLYKIRPSDHN